jgi:carbon monoxide dehydrogenase subunit G
MIHSESSIEIAKPVAGVFGFVCDFSKAPGWLESCVDLAPTSPGGVGADAALHYAYRQGGHSGEMAGKVTAWEENRQLRMALADSMFAVTIQFLFEAAAAGTKVSHSVAIEPKGRMGRMMQPMIQAANQRQVEANLSRLKKILEQER